MSDQAPVPRTERSSGWVIGRVAAVPVVLSPGWLVAAVVLTVILLPIAQRVAPLSGPLAHWLLAGAAVVLLFVSTFLHELAHATVAKRFGMPVHKIALTLLGGHTELGGRAPGPAASALVAVSGPVTNAVIAVLAWLVYRAMPQYGPPAALVLATAVTNGFVAVLNLLPGLPLDGGFVLEAAVWAATGRRATGTVAAGWVGRVLAAAMVVWSAVPLLTGTPDVTRLVWGLFIGSFVWMGAGHAIRASATEEVLDRLVLSALSRPAPTLRADLPVAQLDVVAEHGSAAVLVDADDVPVAYVDADAARSVPAALRAGTPLHAVASPLPPEARVLGHLTGREAVDAVRDASARSAVMVVLGPYGRPTGLLHATDVVRALQGR